MSRRASGPVVNFTSHVAGLGRSESDAAIPTYHTQPMTQTFTAIDFDMQVSAML